LSDSSFVAGSLAGEDDELDAAAALVVVLLMQLPRMLLVPAYWLAFADDQAPNLAVPDSHPCPKLVSAEESARQSQEALNLSFLESAGKNQTFHKCQAFDCSTNLGIKIYLAPS
jgi:hypothetical protein